MLICSFRLIADQPFHLWCCKRLCGLTFSQDFSNPEDRRKTRAVRKRRRSRVNMGVGRGSCSATVANGILFFCTTCLSSSVNRSSEWYTFDFQTLNLNRWRLDCLNYKTSDCWLSRLLKSQMTRSSLSSVEKSENADKRESWNASREAPAPARLLIIMRCDHWSPFFWA